jgi:exportin-7
MTYVLHTTMFAISAGYVNFGVMRFYSDFSVDEMITGVFGLIARVDQEFIMSYPKLCRAYFAAMEKVFELFPNAVTSESSLEFIIQALGAGLLTTDRIVLTSASKTINTIATHTLIHMNSTGSIAPLCVHFSRYPDTWAKLLMVYKDLIPDEDAGWILSRSMFPLACLRLGIMKTMMADLNAKSSFPLDQVRYEKPIYHHTCM